MIRARDTSRCTLCLGEDQDANSRDESAGNPNLTLQTAPLVGFWLLL